MLPSCRRCEINQRSECVYYAIQVFRKNQHQVMFELSDGSMTWSYECAQKMGGYCECLKYLSRCRTLYDSMVFPGFLYVDRAERKRRKKTFETLLKLANFYGSFFCCAKKIVVMSEDQSIKSGVWCDFLLFSKNSSNCLRANSHGFFSLIISLQYTCMFLFNSFDLFQSIQ